MSAVADTATLAHGYSMGDVDRIARKAAASAFAQHGDFAERMEDAWHAVVVALYEAHERPTRAELLLAGQNAVNRAYSDWCRHRGLNGQSEYAERPAFATYWRTVTDAHDGFTDRLCEHLALPQAMAVLTAREYRALAALAASGSHAEAAAHLNLTLRTFHAHLAAARSSFKTAWYAPEHSPARRIAAKDANACGRGHDRAEHGYLSKQGKWACHACQRSYNARHKARNRERYAEDARTRRAEQRAANA